MFQNPITQSLNPTITKPTMRPTKGPTCRRSAKMSSVVFLIRDPETVHACEEYARESFYEEEGDQPPLRTPLTAGTITRKHMTPARGEAHNLHGAKQGPQQGPPARTWTRTPGAGNPSGHTL